MTNSAEEIDAENKIIIAEDTKVNFDYLDKRKLKKPVSVNLYTPQPLPVTGPELGGSIKEVPYPNARSCRDF